MKLQYLSAALLFSIASIAHAGPEICEDLLDYQETQLSTDLEKASKNITSPQQSLKTLKSVKKEAQSLNAESDINKVFLLLSHVKTANEKIAANLKINPSTGAFLQGGKTNAWIDYVVKHSEDAEVLDIIGQSKIENYLLWESVNSASLINAVTNLHKYSVNTLVNKNKNKDSSELLAQINTKLSVLEKELNNANKNVTTTSGVNKGINNFKKEISKVCK